MASPGPWTERVEALRDTICQVMDITGTVGMSIGLRHQNETHDMQIGYKDLSTKTPPDADTIYHLASRSKFMTSAAIALLVDQGKLSWDTLIVDALPGFKLQDDDFNRTVTIMDLMTMRSGLDASSTYWQADHAEVVLPYVDSVKTATGFSVLAPNRTKWIYNNWGHTLAGHVVEHVSGMSLGQFMRKHFFDPLGLENLSFKHGDLDDPAFAKPYLWVGEGQQPLLGSYPDSGDERVHAGSFGVKGSVADLVQFCDVFLQAVKDQQATGKTETPGNPFRQAVTLSTGQFAVDAADSTQGQYAPGWVLQKLPAPMSHVITPNGLVLEDAPHPHVGKGLESPPQVLFAMGSSPGFLGFTIIVPESRTTITVETNTLGSSDAANWVGSMVLEAILDVPREMRIDYIPLAKQGLSYRQKVYHEALAQIAATRTVDTYPAVLSNYVGKYWNPAKTYCLDIFVAEQDGKECLWWAPYHDRRDERHLIRPYKPQEMEWALTHLEHVARGVWPVWSMQHFILTFTLEGDRVTAVKRGDMEELFTRAG